MTPREISIPLPGLTLAAKVWGDPSGLPTLALHGWLDNASSFDGIAPHLKNLHLVCLDLPGHGLSDHKPVGTYLHLIDVAIDVIQVADALGWSQFALLGHSLGAALASLIAGTLQERIIGLALLDGLGGLTTEAEESPEQLRQFLFDLKSLPDKTLPFYPNLETAAMARIAVCPMKLESAQRMLKRSLIETSEKKWTWRSDPRLRLASALQLTRGQTKAFLENITAPSLLVRPEPGFPFEEKMMAWRIEAVKNLSVVKTEGGHHVHLDEPQKIATLLNRFFNALS
ncbi:MAG: alpha/beta hydrolase [Gammaproteobacteria bacterium]